MREPNMEGGNMTGIDCQYALAWATYSTESLLLSSSLWPEVVSMALSALLGSQGI
jgi:hypothetical protein